jgi:hypothetical protein
MLETLAMSTVKTPEQPKNSFRVTLNLTSSQRIDSVLLDELRAQDRNLDLKNMSRTKLKALFKERRIQIKGQSAVPSSSIAVGTTFVDILGYEENAS